MSGRGFWSGLATLIGDLILFGVGVALAAGALAFILIRIGVIHV